MNCRPMSSYILLNWRAFDVELIYIAEHLRIPTGEVAVRWTEIEGILTYF